MSPQKRTVTGRRASRELPQLLFSFRDWGVGGGRSSLAWNVLIFVLKVVPCWLESCNAILENKSNTTWRFYNAVISWYRLARDQPSRTFWKHWKRFKKNGTGISSSILADRLDCVRIFSLKSWNIFRWPMPSMRSRLTFFHCFELHIRK